ncbi:hypothetical protein M5K25_008943 [Dendrobium thyrsiflorum]|uniref:Zinc knuckle CX2CX4HX4C domain-containing protein n=1 Tax=Dendrobium thyrsiflorum TaxID=117978 RepID=A0ABD0VGQ1_DENTH
MAKSTAPNAGYESRSKETVIAIDSGHAVDSEPVIPSMKIPVSGMVANNETEDEQQQEAQRKRLEKVAKVSCATCLSLSGAIITAGVDASAAYPETIPICVDGKIFNLMIQYEWRPSLCSCCNSINHQDDRCPSNPNRVTQVAKPPPKAYRGRSTSRKPRPHSLNAKGILPTPTESQVAVPPENPAIPPTSDSTDNTASHLLTNPIPPPPSVIAATTTHQPIDVHKDHAPSTDNAQKIIPNLNSPSKDTSSSTGPLIHSKASPTTKLISPNKFALLQASSEAESASSLDPGDQSSEQISNSKTTQATSKVTSHSNRQTRAKGSRR